MTTTPAVTRDEFSATPTHLGRGAPNDPGRAEPAPATPTHVDRPTPTAFLVDHVGLVLDAVVDPAWCAARIAELAHRGFAATGEAYPARYRDNDRLVFDDAALAAELFARAHAALPAELVVDGARWELAGLNPRFRACRYAGGQAFCIHRDGAHVASDDLSSHLTL